MLSDFMVIFVLCKNQSNNPNKQKILKPKQTKVQTNKNQQKHQQPLQAKKHLKLTPSPKKKPAHNQKTTNTKTPFS